jgi:hypothetical protein
MEVPLSFCNTPFHGRCAHGGHRPFTRLNATANVLDIFGREAKQIYRRTPRHALALIYLPPSRSYVHAPRPKGERRPADVIGNAVKAGRLAEFSTRNIGRAGSSVD